MLFQRPNSNKPVADILNEIAHYLEQEEENKYKIVTYKRAAMIVRSLPFDITQMENLSSIKGIGDTLAALIGEILNTKTCALVERLRKKYCRKVTDGRSK